MYIIYLFLIHIYRYQGTYFLPLVYLMHLPSISAPRKCFLLGFLLDGTPQLVYLLFPRNTLENRSYRKNIKNGSFTFNFLLG